MLAEKNTMEEARCWKRTSLLMGNQFEITVVSQDEDWAGQLIDMAVDKIRRIEKRLTTFKDDGETALINRNAGVQRVKVSEEDFENLLLHDRFAES
ncbi:FAD:protein FMN transferase [Flavisolibacter nicotianae]|uniref:FAD:protein FMN transferase n=1 Tax=Flavisolibacter nicotianae TaxID=2364882 RepID=UPI0013C4E230|nr:FAD:protein FMN transferase [Flavisolibacter nicotianae]